MNNGGWVPLMSLITWGLLASDIYWCNGATHTVMREHSRNLLASFYLLRCHRSFERLDKMAF